MTNEELAIKAAQGDAESLNNLYFNVVPLLYKLISHYFPLCTKRITSPEDLLQCGFFAVLKAVKEFSPEKGYLFNTYLNFSVSNVCLQELGFRGKHQVEIPTFYQGGIWARTSRYYYGRVITRQSPRTGQNNKNHHESGQRRLCRKSGTPV